MNQLALFQNDEAGHHPGIVGTANSTAVNRTKPVPTGQCGQVLNLIREFQPVASFDISIGHAIPELAARVHDLRAMGFNVVTTILPRVMFRGAERRNVASYSMGSPEWPRPGFFADEVAK